MSAKSNSFSVALRAKANASQDVAVRIVLNAVADVFESVAKDFEPVVPAVAPVTPVTPVVPAVAPVTPVTPVTYPEPTQKQ